MNDGNEKDAQGTLMFNPFNMWKNIYFLGEESMTAITRKAVETKAFAGGVDLVLNSYLQYLKMQKELGDLFMENLPFASRRDSARVAKLVVSLENKVDRIEDDMFNELAEIKENTDTAARMSAIEAEIKEIKKIVGDIKKSIKPRPAKPAQAKKEP